MTRKFHKLPIRKIVDLPLLFHEALFGLTELELVGEQLSDFLSEWRVKIYSRGSKGIITKLII
jgi:hypothetical protein